MATLTEEESSPSRNEEQYFIRKDTNIEAHITGFKISRYMSAGSWT
jgi:hypothetical protein